MAKTEVKSSKTPKVKVYSTTTCPWCVKAKEFLTENNVKYEDINVSLNPEERNKMFEKSGQMGVPVIEIGNTIIVGFDRAGIKKALNLK